jgi:hypothetical protein
VCLTRSEPGISVPLGIVKNHQYFSLKTLTTFLSNSEVPPPSGMTHCPCLSEMTATSGGHSRPLPISVGSNDGSSTPTTAWSSTIGPSGKSSLRTLRYSATPVLSVTEKPSPIRQTACQHPPGRHFRHSSAHSISSARLRRPPPLAGQNSQRGSPCFKRPVGGSSFERSRRSSSMSVPSAAILRVEPLVMPSTISPEPASAESTDGSEVTVTDVKDGGGFSIVGSFPAVKKPPHFSRGDAQDAQ